MCGTSDDTGAAVVLNGAGDGANIGNARKEGDSCRHDAYDCDDSYDGGGNCSNDNAEGGSGGGCKCESFPSAEAHCGGSRRSRSNGDDAEQHNRSCASEVYVTSC